MKRPKEHLPPSPRLVDHVTLGVLTGTIPGDLVDQIPRETGRQSQRQRRLPARLVVYDVMGLSLYMSSSCCEVLRSLVEGVRWLHQEDMGWIGGQVGDHPGARALGG